MKKQSVTLLAIILSVGGFLFPCGNKMNKNAAAETLRLDSVSIEASEHLFGDAARPACDLKIRLTYVSKAASDTLQKEINDFFLALSFGNEYIGMEPQEAIERYRDAYIHEYKHDLEPILLKDEEGGNEREIGAWYNYNQSIHSRVLLNKGELLVYSNEWNDYTGGAHPMYFRSFLNLDLKEMRPLRLDDIFIGEYTEPLTDLLWEQLMKDQKADSREALLEEGYASTGELTPTENFYLGKDKITFYYNVYELAPYYMGPIQISLPYSAVSHMLGSHTAIRDARS